MAFFQKSADASTEIARLAQAYLKKRRVATALEATDLPDNPALRASSGEVYFLGNLIGKCEDAPRRQWRGIVAQHFGSLLDASGVIEPEDLGIDALRSQIRTRLLQDLGQKDEVDFSYARSFAPGVIMALCVDYPSTVRTLTTSTVEKLPMGLDELFSIGQANVDDERIDAREELGSGSGVTALSGGSLFIASKVANMPRLIADHLGLAPHGVVFSIPHRGLILSVNPTFIESISSIQALVAFTTEFAEGRYGPLPGGAVSFGVYYWNDGTVEQIAGKLGMEPMSVDATGPFGEMLNRLENA